MLVRFFTYLSVAIQNKQKSQQDMAKVQINSEKLTPFGGIFQSWSNLTPCYNLLLTQHWVRDAAVSSDTSSERLYVR